MEYVNKNERVRGEFMTEATEKGYELYSPEVVATWQADILAKSKANTLSNEDLEQFKKDYLGLREVVLVNDDLTKSLLFYREPLTKSVDGKHKEDKDVAHPTDWAHDETLGHEDKPLKETPFKDEETRRLHAERIHETDVKKSEDPLETVLVALGKIKAAPTTDNVVEIIKMIESLKENKK